MLNSKQGISRLTYLITFPYSSYLNVLLILPTQAREEFIYKRSYSGNSIESFKQKLREVNWNEGKQFKVACRVKTNTT